jgi:MOSC domain-containing protein YiiM
VIQVLVVRAGKVVERDSPRGTWLSAVYKQPIKGAAYVGQEGVVGDEQADRIHHGGPDKAILAYCLAHYELWTQEIGPIQSGSFGENLQVEGQSEDEVCIGDTYELGAALLQVSQPRQPCWKPATLLGIPDLTRQMAQKNRTGWYFRVLRQGFVEAPAELKLIDRPHADWTVGRANRLVYLNTEPEAMRLKLADLPQLSGAWRSMLTR